MNATPFLSRWRASAVLCCAVIVLLAGCGAGNQGLSNGPQLAALEVANAGPAAQPAAAEPAVNDLPPEAPTPVAAAMPEAPATPVAPAPSPDASTSAPAATADAFALSGYGATQSSGSTDPGAATSQ